MRFLMLNWRDPKNPLTGGAERVTEGYLSALQKRGHEVYWFAYQFPGGSPEEVISGIKIIRGGGAFVLPIFQRAERISLRTHKLEVTTRELVYKIGRAHV